MQIPTTLWSHAPTLAVIVVTSGLLIRYFPSFVAVCTKDAQRRRAALEVLRLRRKDAAKIPTYLPPEEAAAPTPESQHKVLSSRKPKTAERTAVK